MHGGLAVDIGGGSEMIEVDNRNDWQIPSSVIQHLELAPGDQPVVLLLRHSVRNALPPDDTAYALPITEEGKGLAVQLGQRLGKRLKTLHTSPLVRCVQTAEALRVGAGLDTPIVHDRLLGDPGVYVIDGRRAWVNWQTLGHEGVMEHLVSQSEALPGMARPDEAARFLVQHMLAVAGNLPGIHVFVTHDSLITATAARLLGQKYGVEDWPWFLEGAFFWRTKEGLRVAYRNHSTVHESERLCTLCENDVIDFARREIAATVGLDIQAKFFLAGGAFKTLLSGHPSRDLDLWAASEQDREAVLQALRERGARPTTARPFADAFEVAGRLVEIPHKVTPPTLAERLALFDIALSAIGVEFDSDGSVRASIHPLAIQSVQHEQILLLKPLVNWKYALATLERMRRYAKELGFSVPAQEEEEIWRVFQSQSLEMRAGMVERFHRTAEGGFGVLEELLCRFP